MKIGWLFFMIWMPFVGIQGQEFHWTNDYNKDGYTDTLSFVQYGTYETYIEDIVFRDGKHLSSHEFGKSIYSKGDFLSVITIPDLLTETSYQSVLDTVQHLLGLDRIMKDESSASLDWLLQAYEFESGLDEDSHYFKRKFHVPIHWQKGNYQHAEMECLIMDVSNLYLPDNFFPKGKTQKAWLIYYGHNHQLSNHLAEHTSDTSNKGQWIGSTSKGDIYKTQHGLYIQKKKKWAWLFHSNHSLTGGPGKLRWTSIGKVEIHKDMIMVHHTAPVIGIHQVFWIHISSGQVNELYLGNDDEIGFHDGLDMKIHDDIFRVNFYENDDQSKRILKIVSYPFGVLRRKMLSNKP